MTWDRSHGVAQRISCRNKKNMASNSNGLLGRAARQEEKKCSWFRIFIVENVIRHWVCRFGRLLHSSLYYFQSSLPLSSLSLSCCSSVRSTMRFIFYRTFTSNGSAMEPKVNKENRRRWDDGPQIVCAVSNMYLGWTTKCGGARW